jgi:hypothetical protein
VTNNRLSYWRIIRPKLIKPQDEETEDDPGKTGSDQLGLRSLQSVERLKAWVEKTPRKFESKYFCCRDGSCWLAVEMNYATEYEEPAKTLADFNTFTRPM